MEESVVDLEVERRTERYDERYSRPVIFSDGTAWDIPIPKPACVFRTDEDGSMRPILATVAYDDPDLNELIDAVLSPVSSGMSKIELVQALASGLLRYNYDLSRAELGPMLEYRVRDAACEKWVEDVMGIILGSRNTL